MYCCYYFNNNIIANSSNEIITILSYSVSYLIWCIDIIKVFGDGKYFF